MLTTTSVDRFKKKPLNFYILPKIGIYFRSELPHRELSPRNATRQITAFAPVWTLASPWFRAKPLIYGDLLELVYRSCD